MGMLSLGALAARVWPPNSGFVKNYGLWEPDGPGADLSKGQILVVTETPPSSLLEAPLLWQHSLTGLWWVILRGDSPASHFFPFPYQLSKSQVGASSNVLCISWDSPPQGRADYDCMYGDPPKMPNFLVLAGSQGWYAYLKKSLIPVGPRLGLWVPRPYLLNFWFSQVYISSGEGGS